MMDVQQALAGQYHAALGMLRQAVERCPDDLWLAGKHPRSTWRIAYHAAFFADLYMGQAESAFTPWAKHRDDCTALWESPPLDEPYTRAELIEYIDHIDAKVDSTVGALDLDTEDSGFPWYPNITKLEHEMMSVRHIQGHVGQISELLMAHGIDTDWMGRARR